MKVRATRLGYYGHERRPEGSVFTLEPIKRLRAVKGKDGKPTGQMREITISAEQQFSERWMERVSPASKPVKEKAKPKGPEAAEATSQAEPVSTESTESGI